MPRIANVGEAKARLSRLIACAEAGEDVERQIDETIALMRQERGRRPHVSAADTRAAKQHGRS